MKVFTSHYYKDGIKYDGIRVYALTWEQAEKKLKLIDKKFILDGILIAEFGVNDIPHEMYNIENQN